MSDLQFLIAVLLFVYLWVGLIVSILTERLRNLFLWPFDVTKDWKW